MHTKIRCYGILVKDDPAKDEKKEKKKVHTFAERFQHYTHYAIWIHSDFSRCLVTFFPQNSDDMMFISLDTSQDI